MSDQAHSTVARSPALAHCHRALSSFTAFSVVLLLLDAAAKFLLFQYFDGLNRALGQHWRVTVAVQFAALLCLAALSARVLRMRPRDFACPALFIAALIAASFACTAFQDYSYDGGWYHFLRVNMFPIASPLGNVIATVRGDPSVFYPLLADNLRGLAITLLHTGPFSGISVNIASVAAALWFWDRFATFLPRWMRWIAAVSPVAAVQMVTYYGDGWVATVGAMGLLVAILLVQEWTAPQGGTFPADSGPSTGMPAITIFLVAFTLLLAQLKLSFPALVVEFTVPAWLALAVGALSARRGGAGPLASAARRLGVQFADGRGLAAAALACAAGLLALANPYFLYIQSAVSTVPYPWFAPASLRHWSDLALVYQVHELFGTMPGPALFYYANMTAVWPGPMHALVEPQVHGAADLVRSLFVRIATVDARFSGFGPMSALVLFYAIWRSVAELRAGKAGFAAGNPGLPTLLAATFVVELLIVTFVPLAWWARMAPPIYSVATLLVLLRLGTVLKGWAAPRRPALRRAAPIAMPLLCVLLIVPAIALPAPVTLSRVVYKAKLVRTAVRPLAEQVAARPGRTLMLPNHCPPPITNSELQSSFASKFLTAFPDLRLKAAFRSDDLCDRRTVEINAGMPLCYCAE